MMGFGGEVSVRYYVRLKGGEESAETGLYV
jgi:hypothetical protein